MYLLAHAVYHADTFSTATSHRLSRIAPLASTHCTCTFHTALFQWVAGCLWVQRNNKVYPSTNSFPLACDRQSAECLLASDLM